MLKVASGRYNEFAVEFAAGDWLDGFTHVQEHPKHLYTCIIPPTAEAALKIYNNVFNLEATASV